MRPENVPDSIMRIGRRMNANAGGVARAAGGDGGNPGGEQDIASAATVDARDMVIARATTAARVAELAPCMVTGTPARARVVVERDRKKSHGRRCTPSKI